MTIASLVLPIARRNPAQIPVRNLVLASGEGLQLTIRIVQEDRPASPAVDLSGLGPKVRLVIWGHSGQWAGDALISNVETGRADVLVAPATGATWPRSCHFEVQADLGGVVSTLCRGTLQVLGGHGDPSDGVALLDDFYAPALGDDYKPLEA